VISTEVTSKLVVHTAVGRTELTEISAAMTAWYDHADFNPDLPVLWDMRATTFERPPEDLVASWSEANRVLINARRPGRKTAWVLPDTEVTAFAVDLLTRSDFHHRVRIFHHDMEAAVSWLTSTIR